MSMGQDCLSLGDVAASLASTRRGKPVAPQTVNRWIRQGVPLRDGARLRLEARRLPGGWMTTQADVDAFIDRLTADALTADGQ